MAEILEIIIDNYIFTKRTERYDIKITVMNYKYIIYKKMMHFFFIIKIIIIIKNCCRFNYRRR